MASAPDKKKIYIYIPGPSNRSPLEAFAGLKVAGGDLLEGAGICILRYFLQHSFVQLVVTPNFYIDINQRHM